MVDWKLVFYPRPVNVITSVYTLVLALPNQTIQKIFSDNLHLFTWPYDASDNGINIALLQIIVMTVKEFLVKKFFCTRVRIFFLASSLNRLIQRGQMANCCCLKYLKVVTVHQ